MSGCLLDVNVLLACGWKSHADHSTLLSWLLQVNDWATSPITESGFMRISMTTAWQVYSSCYDRQRWIRGKKPVYYRQRQIIEDGCDQMLGCTPYGKIFSKLTCFPLPGEIR